MRRFSRTRELDADAIARLLTPRDDVVGERLDGTAAEGTYRFVQQDGPFEHYERRVEVETPISPNGAGAPDHQRVVETVELGLPTATWRFVTERVFAYTLRRPERPGRVPWWAPPQRPDAHAALALGVLATLSLVSGYLGTLLSQTMTFAADEFNAGNTAQSFVLSAARIGGVLSIVLTALADRRGRRRMLAVSLMICIGSSVITALTPNLVALTVAQVVNRGSLIAAGLLIVIFTAEEMPAGARAWAVSLLAMISALGAGMALWILPVADHGVRAWRILYAVPLLAVPLVLRRVRLLPESRRFERQHRNLSLAGHTSRLWLLAIASFLLNVFIAPQTQFRNEFLRDHRGFSAAAISLFVIVTATPGGIGIITGGRLAETLGRRVVGSVAIAGGVALTAASFSLSGAAMWVTACLGTIIFAAHVAAITVYGPELFPTSLRGKANGIIAVTAMGGSVVGLLAAGVLADAFDSFGPTMAILAVAPLAMAVLVYARFPETAQRELEELNPDDAVAEAAGLPTGGGAADGPDGAADDTANSPSPAEDAADRGEARG